MISPDFGIIKTKLDFPALQRVARWLQKPLCCGMCGHEFPGDAETSDHECKPPMWDIQVTELKPLEGPVGGIFYDEYKV